jgi:hypothetical protein
VYLVYKPDGQPEQRWHYEPGRLHSGEMLLVEKASGFRYGAEFKQELMLGSTLARKALLWVMLRRTHQAIKLADVDFYDEQLQLIQDKDEIAAELAAMESEERPEGMSDAQWSAGLALLRRQLSEAPDAPGKAPTGTTAEPPCSPAGAPESGTSAASPPPPAPMPDPAPPAESALILPPTAPLAATAVALTPPAVPAASTS